MMFATFTNPYKNIDSNEGEGEQEMSLRIGQKSKMNKNRNTSVKNKNRGEFYMLSRKKDFDFHNIDKKNSYIQSVRHSTVESVEST